MEMINISYSTRESQHEVNIAVSRLPFSFLSKAGLQSRLLSADKMLLEVMCTEMNQY